MPAASDKAYLVLDQGGHANRALIFDRHGKPVAGSAGELTTDRRRGVEQDPEAIVAGMRECIDRALAESGLEPDRIEAAGLACQRASVVCWDRDSGRALTPVLSWQDTRATAHFDRIELDPAALAGITGLVPSAHYGASKLAWCLENVPPVREAAAAGRLACGPLVSYLIFCLLDDRPLRVNYTIAQRTLLFDVQACDWSPLLLDAFGIPRGPLPECVPDVSEHGRLSIGGGHVDLRVVCGDQNALPLAFGDPDPETACLNLGTGGFLLQPLPGDEVAPPGFLKTLLPIARADTRFAVEGTINGAGAALDWLGQRHGLAVDWQRLDASDPDVDGPLFINSIGDLGSPWWQTGVQPRFVPDPGSFDSCVHAVLESIAFLVRANLERMAPVESPIRQVWVGGGLSRSRLVCRMLAEVLGIPVLRPASPEEMSSRALLALLCPGLVISSAGARTFRPRAGQVPVFARRYRRWLELMAKAVDKARVRAGS